MKKSQRRRSQRKQIGKKSQNKTKGASTRYQFGKFKVVNIKTLPVFSLVIVPSDLRFKTDIRNVQNATEKLRSITGVSFQYRVNQFKNLNLADGQQLGFVAQEIEKVFPEIVSKDSKGYKYVNYVALISPLVEAVKELAAEQDALKATVENIKKELRLIKSRPSKKDTLLKVKKSLGAQKSVRQ